MTKPLYSLDMCRRAAEHIIARTSIMKGAEPKNIREVWSEDKMEARAVWDWPDGSMQTDYDLAHGGEEGLPLNHDDAVLKLIDEQNARMAEMQAILAMARKGSN